MTQPLLSAQPRRCVWHVLWTQPICSFPSLPPAKQQCMDLLHPMAVQLTAIESPPTNHPSCPVPLGGDQSPLHITSYQRAASSPHPRLSILASALCNPASALSPCPFSKGQLAPAADSSVACTLALRYGTPTLNPTPIRRTLPQTPLSASKRLRPENKPLAWNHALNQTLFDAWTSRIPHPSSLHPLPLHRKPTLLKP